MDIESMLAMAKGVINEIADKKDAIKKSRISILLNILHYINVILHKFQSVSIVTFIILLTKSSYWLEIEDALCAAYIAFTSVFIFLYFLVKLIVLIEDEDKSVIPFKYGDIVFVNYSIATVISIIWDIFSIITLIWLNVLIGRL